jgi:GINS complex subunit 1
MNYGNYGRDLLLELKRSEETAELPAYNDATVTACLEDLALHVQALHDIVTAADDDSSLQKVSQEVKPSLMLQEAAIRRNKRCLLTYHWLRLQRLQKQQQQTQTDDSSSIAGITTPDKDQHLAPAEQEFLREYRQLQKTYAKGLPVDGIKSSFPPLNVDRVLVRVNEEIGSGPIVLGSGQAVHFVPGATQYLLWTDVEDWVRAGKLVLMQGEEEHEQA